MVSPKITEKDFNFEMKVLNLYFKTSIRNSDSIFNSQPYEKF